MPGIGGGEASGGSVVQYTDPAAAMKAGNLGAMAAFSASQMASGQIQTAIQQLNSSYRAASSMMMPWTQTGIQALDQMNQYLGLDPFKPASAPTNPTMESLAAKMTSSQVRDYIGQNIQLSQNQGGFHPGTPGAKYTGYGTAGSGAEDWWSSGADNAMDAVSQMMYDPNVNHLARLGAAQQALPDAQAQYAIDKSNYDQQMAWAEQYKTPYTYQEINDRISNEPGFQAELKAGTDTISKLAASRGFTGSGAILKELSALGQGQLSKYYGAKLSQLGALAGAGQQAAGTVASLMANQGNNVAQLYGQMGDVQANSQLTGANSLMQAIIAANQNYKVVGQQSSGGGGLGGIGELLGGVASLKQAFSSELLKDKISTPSTKEILERVNELELDKWTYKGIDREHIGPYAEQFNELFGLKESNSINLIDALGVSLGSIKELTKRIEQLEARIS